MVYVARTKTSASRGKGTRRQIIKYFAELSRGRDHQSGHLIERLSARFDGRVLGVLEHPEHLDLPLPGLGSRGGYSGQHRTGCHLRVGGITLPLLAPGGPVGSIDLDDGIASVGEEPSDSGTIRACAFDPERADLPLAAGPTFELHKPRRAGFHVTLCQANALLIDSYCYMRVSVSINSDNHLDGVATCPVYHCGHLDLLQSDAPAR
jgi:hypothetical protein